MIRFNEAVRRFEFFHCCKLAEFGNDRSVKQIFNIEGHNAIAVYGSRANNVNDSLRTKYFKRIKKRI
jgi:hypothetical protein